MSACDAPVRHIVHQRPITLSERKTLLQPKGNMGGARRYRHSWKTKPTTHVPAGYRDTLERQRNLAVEKRDGCKRKRERARACSLSGRACWAGVSAAKTHRVDVILEHLLGHFVAESKDFVVGVVPPSRRALQGFVVGHRIGRVLRPFAVPRRKAVKSANGDPAVSTHRRSMIGAPMPAAHINTHHDG